MTPCVVRRRCGGFLGGFGLGQDLIPGDALHVVNLAGVLLHAFHELLLVVGLEHPTAFTFDSLLHVTPWLPGLALPSWPVRFGESLQPDQPLSCSTLTTRRQALRRAIEKRASSA